MTLTLTLPSPADGTAPPLLLSGAATQTLESLAPSETVEVVFPMEASALGQAELIVVATDASTGAQLDALSLEIPVVGALPRLSVATSRAIEASADGRRRTIVGSPLATVDEAKKLKRRQTTIGSQR